MSGGEFAYLLLILAAFAAFAGALAVVSRSSGPPAA
jgi:hypothetical protein